MAYTLDDLQKDVLSRLNEASDSPVGEFHAGDGSAAVISTKDAVTKYLNDGAADLARTAYPITGEGTVTAGANQRIVRLQDLAVTGGGVLWAARQVKAATTPLERANRSFVEIYYPQYDASGTGSPKCWHFEGGGSIALAPIPPASVLVTVSGLITPPPLVNPTDVAAWLQPDLYKSLVYYSAYMIAYKNIENPALEKRAPIWQKAWLDGKAQLRATLSASDPRLFRAHFLIPDAKV